MKIILKTAASISEEISFFYANSEYLFYRTVLSSFLVLQKLPPLLCFEINDIVCSFISPLRRTVKERVNLKWPSATTSLSASHNGVSNKCISSCVLDIASLFRTGYFSRFLYTLAKKRLQLRGNCAALFYILLFLVVSAPATSDQTSSHSLEIT